jgi:hypothetical protein
MWIGFFWLRIGPAAGSCKHGHESSDFVKGGKFLGQLNYYQFLKKDCSMELVVCTMISLTVIKIRF